MASPPQISPQTSTASPLGEPVVPLIHGFDAVEIDRRLLVRVRVRVRKDDVGERERAFYLVEMDENRNYQVFACNSVIEYALKRLEMEPRRTREMLRIGRLLLTIPLIDRAFCDGRIGWAKLLLFTRVASPEHQEEWLERAMSHTFRELALDVRTSRPGGRAPGPWSGRSSPTSSARGSCARPAEAASRRVTRHFLGLAGRRTFGGRPGRARSASGARGRASTVHRTSPEARGGGRASEGRGEGLPTLPPRGGWIQEGA
ncbi:MAG: hypothetical protein ACC662_01330 [Planctomycetota bacterium]